MATSTGEGGFPERLPWLILCGRFQQEMISAVERWAEWATETVEAWPDDITSAEPDLETLDAMATQSETHEPRARRADAPVLTGWSSRAVRSSHGEPGG